MLRGLQVAVVLSVKPGHVIENSGVANTKALRSTMGAPVDQDGLEHVAITVSQDRITASFP